MRRCNNSRVMLSASRVIQIGLLASALFGSFFITLWLTEPDTSGLQPIGVDNRSDVEKLSARKITSDLDLLNAARDIGLHLSARMTGNIDVVNRTSARDVSVVGWVADKEGDATPTSILVFAGGAFVATTQTKGERPDVTQTLHLGLGSEKNVSFSVTFSCQPGDQPVIVGIATAKQYISLASRPCP
jgi:hypothetical protein